MNDLQINKRHRGRTLLIVEGFHEEQVLIPSLTRAFPEILGRDPDILVYRTNIYMLYGKLTKIYGDDLLESDIDLPYVISTDNNSSEILYKRDFINIILIFDYERHDPNFSEDSICLMQKIFTDMTDNGQLYLNYPMVESYWDFKELPDKDFMKRKAFVQRRGSEYKSKLNDSFVKFSIELPVRIDDILRERFENLPVDTCKKCIDEIMAVSKDNLGLKMIKHILDKHIQSGDTFETANLFWAMIEKTKYWEEGNYGDYLRKLLLQIVLHTIRKGIMLSGETEITDISNHKEEYELVNLFEILKSQNNEGKNTGYVWVLNTSILLVVEYNSNVLDEPY